MIQLRNRLGLSQQQLAQLADTKQPTISRFEKGLINPSIGFLQKLAHALDKKLVIEFK